MGLSPFNLEVYTCRAVIDEVQLIELDRNFGEERAKGIDRAMTREYYQYNDIQKPDLSIYLENRDNDVKPSREKYVPPHRR